MRSLRAALGVLAVTAGLLVACGPDELPPVENGGGVLVPTRIGDGPTTTPPTTAMRVTTSGQPAVAGTLPVPTAPQGSGVPDGTARPSQGLGDLPSQAGDGITDSKVFVLGDSVLEKTGACCTNELARVLEPLGWKVVLDAQDGRTPAQALEVLRSRRAEIGQVAVILIGSAQDPGGDFRRDLQTMLSLLAGVPRVVLLTVSEYAPAMVGVNDVILEAGLREPTRIVLVDWNRVSRTAKGVLDTDRLHVTDLGAEVLARTIATVLGPAPTA